MSHVIIHEDDPYELTRQFAYGSMADNRDEVVASLSFTGNRLKIAFQESPSQTIRLLQAGKVITLSNLETEVALSSKSRTLEMHFGPTDEEHYYLVFGTKGTHS